MGGTASTTKQEVILTLFLDITRILTAVLMPYGCPTNFQIKHFAINFNHYTKVNQLKNNKFLWLGEQGKKGGPRNISCNLFILFVCCFT